MTETDGNGPWGHIKAFLGYPEKKHSSEQLKAEAEAKAREAVALFINAEEQESIASYRASGSITFDITKQRKDRAVITRVHSTLPGYLGLPEITKYSFFVISHDPENNPYVWSMYETKENGGLPSRPDYSSSEFHPPYWDIQLQSIKNTEFLVKDTFRNILGLHQVMYKQQVHELSVMMGGLSERQKEPQEAPSSGFSFPKGSPLPKPSPA